MSQKGEEDDRFSNNKDEASSASWADNSGGAIAKPQPENGKKRFKIRKSASQSWVYNKVPNAKDQIENSMKLLQLVTDSQLTSTQVNGQRKLGPPPGWTGPPPGPGCEVFVGSIPKNYYEPDIIPIFSSVGNIYELRLMMDFSGTNRGYCFIMYTKPEEAIRAVEKLDQYEIYPGKKIGVVASINNRRLYVTQLPADMHTETVIKRIYRITDEVEKVGIYRYQNGEISFGLIYYNTHRGAAMARRRLVPETGSVFGCNNVSIEWADPNMTPSNVFEECGISDEDGNIQITKTFIEPIQMEKSTRKHGQGADQRITKWNNQRVSNKQSYPIVPKNHAVKSVPGNVARGFHHSFDDQCLIFEKDHADCLLASYALMELAKKCCVTCENFPPNWDGRVPNIFNRSLHWKDSRRDHPSSQQIDSVLPPIHSYWNKRKKSKGRYTNNFVKEARDYCSCKDRNETLSAVSPASNESRYQRNLSRYEPDTVYNSRPDYGYLNFNDRQRSITKAREFNSENFAENSNLSSVESLIPQMSTVLNISNQNSVGENYVVPKQMDVYGNVEYAQRASIENAGNSVEKNVDRTSNLSLYSDSGIGSSANNFLYPEQSRFFPLEKSGAKNYVQNSAEISQRYEQLSGRVSNQYNMQNAQRPVAPDLGRQVLSHGIPSNGLGPFMRSQENHGFRDSQYLFPPYQRNNVEPAQCTSNEVLTSQSLLYQQSVNYGSAQFNHDYRLNASSSSFTPRDHSTQLWDFEASGIGRKELGENTEGKNKRSILNGTCSNIKIV